MHIGEDLLKRHFTWNLNILHRPWILWYRKKTGVKNVVLQLRHLAAENDNKYLFLFEQYHRIKEKTYLNLNQTKYKL